MMRISSSFVKIALVIALSAIANGFASKAMDSQVLRLWYQQPAEKWTEALPLGNGRLAAMVFGGVSKERIQLNEESLWSGGPRDTNNPEALQYLPQVRQLLFAGKHAEATDLANKHLMGVPKTIKPYQTLGDLWLEFDDHGTITDYRRELDLDAAVARTSFKANGALFSREVFISAPDQVLVIRISCDRRKSINVTLGMSREQDATVVTAGENRLIMSGQLDGGQGMRYQTQLLAVPEGGRILADSGQLRVKKADRLIVFLTAATDFRCGDPAKLCEQYLSASNKSYQQLLDAHHAEHRGYFRRVHLDLGSSQADGLPTDRRLHAIQQGADDPGLAALYFQYVRYLLIASSRLGCLPANLQGKWNDMMNPPWNSDYHTNINLQMNYWPAEVSNLAECAEPLLDFIHTLVEPGRKTARVHYGCDGFVVHHLTDVWGFTTPADGVWGIWPMGAAWLCQHLWEHYAFSGDQEFLGKRGYPIMKEAAQFLLDFLVEDSQGRLVTNPSHSPENAFLLPDGSKSMFCVGATMDLEIIHDLFDNCIQATEILGIDSEFRTKLQADLERLAPLQIGKHGQLQEWLEDYEEAEPGHRHMSHLFALYPGRQITLRGTPGLAKAARRVLERRLEHGGGHTGWSRAWIVNFWARLEEGELAYEHLQALFAKTTAPNLFNLHPPFQIEGNFGGASGIAEMLLQSHDGELNILPALPAAWPDGKVSGLRARGGYELDFSWQQGKLQTLKIRSRSASTVRIRTHKNVRLQPEDKEQKYKLPADELIEIPLAVKAECSLKASDQE